MIKNLEELGVVVNAWNLSYTGSLDNIIVSIETQRIYKHTNY
jgi:hypothetical protein